MCYPLDGRMRLIELGELHAHQFALFAQDQHFLSHFLPHSHKHKYTLETKTRLQSRPPSYQKALSTRRMSYLAHGNVEVMLRQILEDGGGVHRPLSDLSLQSRNRLSVRDRQDIRRPIGKHHLEKEETRLR